MKQYQCLRNHLYQAPEGDLNGCPICAAQAASLVRTRGVWRSEPAAVGDARGDGTADGGRPAPVLGWLVCIDGPERGRDWRLTAGRNALGRAAGMTVRLASDTSVSRDRHALVDADADGRFTLTPGAGPVLCNGRPVAAPLALAAHDRLTVGGSTLMLVPLVGPAFGWGGA